MVNLVHTAELVRSADIEFEQLKARLAFQMLEIGAAAGEEIVHADHAVTLGEPRGAQMRAQQSGGAGEQQAKLWGTRHEKLDCNLGKSPLKPKDGFNGAPE